MLPDFFEFRMPTRVVYGPGLVSDLQAELAQVPALRYLAVSDTTVAGLGLLDRVVGGMAAAGCEVVGRFLDVPPNSEVGTVEACAALAAACGAEAFVAVGGGSVIDTAKMADVLLTLGGDLVDDYSGSGTIDGPLRPLVAVPTTAGTGSEVTSVAVIYDADSRTKLAFSAPALMPDLAVLDPELTLSLPPGLTASTAMDALTHAVEAWVSPQASPVTDALAAKAVDLILRSVERAVKGGDDLEARGGLLVASSLAGMAFSHAMVGCVHGMAHAAGGLYGVPHGVANAILLPYGLEYNLRETHEKLAALAPLAPNVAADTTGPETLPAAEAVIEVIRALTGRLHDLGALPLRLRDVGVPADGLPDIAAATVMDGTSFYNPREVVAEDILAQLERAY
jgi:alcohol dehydrogenase class IV